MGCRFGGVMTNSGSNSLSVALRWRRKLGYATDIFLWSNATWLGMLGGMATSRDNPHRTPWPLERYRGGTSHGGGGHSVNTLRIGGCMTAGGTQITLGLPLRRNSWSKKWGRLGVSLLRIEPAGRKRQMTWYGTLLRSGVSQQSRTAGWTEGSDDAFRNCTVYR